MLGGLNDVHVKRSAQCLAHGHWQVVLLSAFNIPETQEQAFA